MARTAASSGNLYLSVFGASIGSSVKAVNIQDSQALIDASAANDASRVFLKGRTDTLIHIEAFWETAGANPGTVFFAGREGTLVYGPLGSAVSQPKWQGTVIVQNVGLPWSREDGAMITATLKLTAAWTSDGYAGATF